MQTPRTNTEDAVDDAPIAGLGENPRVRPVSREVLSDAWFVLRRATFDWQGADGEIADGKTIMLLQWADRELR